MFRPASTILRSSRLCTKKLLPKQCGVPALRTFSAGVSRCNESKPGQFARTDPTITVEYPEEKDMPSSKPVRRVKRTLGSFSLEGKVAVVTGGARG